MNMKMKILSVPPSKIVNRAVSRYELGRYFDIDSVGSLIVLLRQGSYEDLFSFDVTISADYIDWGEDLRKAKYPLDPELFLGTDLGYTQSKTPRYPLADMSKKIKNGVPLSESEITRVLTELPDDVLERYLRFTLRNFNQGRLRKLVRPVKEVANDYGDYRYNGLAIEGAVVTYQKNPVYMSPQQREVLRLFLERPGKLITRDAFRENGDIFGKEDYTDVDETLGKLIPAVHKKLRQAIGKNCIFNTPREGWTLRIE